MTEMVRLIIELTPDEHKKVWALKGDRKWRTVLFEGLGEDAPEPRTMGRPPRARKEG